MTTATYEYGQQSLKRLLEQAHDGSIQVPEFQRAMALQDDWTISLLASVSLNYPIGLVKLLEAGCPDHRFESRAVVGTPASPSAEPQWLLVDGQYRLSALYQVLVSGQVVRTKDEPRWYYVDIDAALDSGIDRDEAIVSVPADRPDLGTAEQEWERRFFPLRLVFGDQTELRHWRNGFVEHGAVDNADDRTRLIDRFESEVLEAFRGYVLPVLVLHRNTTRWSVRVHGGPEGRILSDRYRVG